MWKIEEERKYEQRRSERREAAEQAFAYLEGLADVTPAMFEAGLAGELAPGMASRFGGLVIDHNLWKTAIELALHPDDRVAFRSSWSLEWAYFHSRQSMNAHVGRFVEIYLAATSPSVHRTYSKMICDMLRCGMIGFSDKNIPAMAERAFDLLVSPQTKPAVKVWTAEILFDMAPHIDWVRESLADTVRRQIELMPSPAILNHGNKLLRRIAVRESTLEPK